MLKQIGANLDYIDQRRKARYSITKTQNKNITMDILLIVCMVLILKLVAVPGLGFLKTLIK